MIALASAPTHFSQAPAPLRIKFTPVAAGALPKVRAVDPQMTFTLTVQLMDEIDRAITMIPDKCTSYNLQELRELMRAFGRITSSISALTASNDGNFREIAELNYRSSVADHFIQQFVQSLGLAVIQSALIDRADFVETVPGLAQRLENAKSALIKAQKPISNAMILCGTAYKRKLNDIEIDEAEESAHPCNSKSIKRMEAHNAIETELAEFMATNVNEQVIEAHRAAINFQELSQDGYDAAQLTGVLNAMHDDHDDYDMAEVVDEAKA